MDKIIAKPRELDKRIRNSLRKGLNTAGIHPKISVDPIPRTKLHRITVVSKEFAQLRPIERQDLVWRIINQEFTPDEQLQISMIITLSPKEAVGMYPLHGS